MPGISEQINVNVKTTGINELKKQISDLINTLNETINIKVNKMENDITKLQWKLEDLKNTEDERDAINCRNRILAFGDDLMHGILHSKDSYDQILQDIRHYNDYCAAHPDFKNHITAHHAKLIECRYMSHLEHNDFLQ